MKNIAIIPARSGSKGLKDKNIKDLKGKPLLAYTIKAARDTDLFDEIFVSTDSKEYAQIAQDWGASVPFLRGEVLSSDTASSWDVVKHTIESFKEMGNEFETAALLQPTSPLRKAQDIVNGYKLMQSKNANAVISVCEVDHSPLWCNTLPGDHSLKNFLNQDLVSTPRQALPSYYRINGAIYIVKNEYLMTTDSIYKEGCYAMIMSKENSIDIDDAVDFKIAEALLSS
ncbi:acylneuraminate cytidylyltransferase family protein [Aquibacillus koreensis]|uniref:Acylneuraminate cytidylyltransferase family protein n=1 Tax=Aquibacillus koreensis TaxID=279446 RepID=A0A9X4AIZ4_9BACI|nr:acylneuraminate cytidylyltransferase family protein [Aquibacillus koreensis]MCT2534644.1 acylneuraminate cytidylyltransferase family protein [Aquibacillus koreensis]MDC3419828.1 acylneuraminate cytidylyltransferase family protein [Aquibacillus koreensis]